MIKTPGAGGHVSERERSQAARAGGSRRRGSVPTYSWARTPPARLVRSGIQYGALVPLLRFISPFTVIGKRNLAKLKGPAVFVANHQSHFDAPVCLAALGTVPFVRSGGSSRDSLQFLKDLAGSGWSVLIFPSGTRGTGASGFKKGFAYIAVDAQVPVVPMYLHGLDQVMPKGSFLPLPGGVVIGIGPPIPPGDDYNQLVVKAEAGVAEVRTVVK